MDTQDLPYFRCSLGIIKGTSKGVVLWEPEKSEPPAAATPRSGKAEVEAEVVVGVDGKAIVAAPAVPDTSKFLSKLPPPSGRSMADARRLGAVGGGIPVSTANKATEPQAEPVAKP